ncbi:unnamed protein product [Acanthoscelides obtectus]|uniref:Cysteine dioxygenase n=1 Tax=Acanthoscelides obtectus TaxID=200917 RepID=A0A9P0K3H5_ACAOB|nr:unnamed protein product [Acanthoscelides obtectus]CAK1632679.1 Cysteine dioxygenase type 1 [Acanthoscelides obtectus]
MSLREYDSEVALCRARQEEDEFDLKFYKQMGDGLPVINDLSDLMRQLRLIFDSDDNHVNIELVRYCMKAYKSNPADWKKYAKFDRYRYTRNLVDSGNGKYNLMALCWGEGHGSGIHDHQNSHCFMKMLQGSLQEIRFAWPEAEGEEMKEVGRTIMKTNDICYINDSLGLHRVENVSNVDTAISLHLYCPPFNTCSVFSQRTGQKSTAKMTFYSLYGKRNKEICDTQEPEDN